MTEQVESYHHGDLRMALLNTAAAMITESGVEHVTMRRLATRVGVSHTAPYRHFKDKSALLAAVAEEGFTRLAASVHAVCLEHAEEPLLCFQGMCVTYVSFAIDHPAHYRLMFGEEVFQRSEHPNVTRAANALFHEVITIVQLCQAANQIKAGSPVEIGLSGWALAHGLSLLLIDRMIPVGEDTPAQVEAAFQALFSGIAVYT